MAHDESSEPSWRDELARAQELQRARPQFQAPPEEILAHSHRPLGSSGSRGSSVRRAPARLYRLEALARRLGVEVDWLRQEIDAGHLKAYRLQGEARVADRELDRWLELQRWQVEDAAAADKSRAADELPETADP